MSERRMRGDSKKTLKSSSACDDAAAATTTTTKQLPPSTYKFCSCKKKNATVMPVYFVTL